MESLLTFRLDDNAFACQLNAVKRVIWAVEITPLPGQTGKVIGVVNVEEVVVPIVDLRRIVGLPDREIDIDDDIVIVDSKFGPVGMIVDTVDGVNNYDGAQLAPISEAIKSYASSVLKLPSHLIVIIDPSKMIKASDIPDVTKFNLAGIQ